MANIDEKNEIQVEEENSLDIKEILYLCLINWFWLVVSIVVCLGAGVLYILRTTPIYTRDAQVVIKEDSKNGQKGISQFDQFADLGLFGSNTNLLNEIATMKSPDMMERVVRQLNLNMDYYIKGSWHNETLYGEDLPITANLYTLNPDEPVSFAVKIGKDSTITLSDFKDKENDFENRTVKGRIGQLLKTPVGQISVHATPHYKSNYPDEIYVNYTSIYSAVEHYCKELTISQDDEKSGVVNLSINDVSPQRADDVISTLINAYNANWVEDKNEIANSTSKFIDERLASIVNELGEVDTDISSFKSANLIPDVTEASKMYMEQVNVANTAILELNNQLYIANYVKSYLMNGANTNQLIPTTPGDASSSLATEIGKYNDLVLDRNNLAANSSTSNPLVIDMDNAIKEMRATIISSINNQIENIRGQIRSQEKYEDQAIGKISSNPQQAKYLLNIERQQKIKESLYLYLLQKREENELSRTFTAYNTRVIKKPQGSNLPTSPKKMQVMLIALVIGIAIPVAMILLINMFNTKVRGRKDLDTLTAPFVGEIPQYRGHNKAAKGQRKKKKGKGEALIVVKEGSRNVINEAFRVIRANLEFMSGSNKVFAITSANPDSGKTFINYNLASSFAIKGKKVLTIDLDLRKGSLSVYAKNPGKGVTDYLVGHVNNINDVIVQDPMNPNLYVLPKGTTPPNPTELLYSPRFPEMMRELRKEFDIIFVDCPPIEIVADASIINKEVDMTLFIVRAGLFERGMLPELQKFYTTGKYKNMAIILNGTEAGGQYGHHYGYRYGYSYGYGYSKYGSYSGYTHDDE